MCEIETKENLFKRYETNKFLLEWDCMHPRNVVIYTYYIKEEVLQDAD